MPEELLQTKLYIPPLRPNLVPRPHLIERLNQGLQQGCKLTLISAPAGFGNTTLVSESNFTNLWIAIYSYFISIDKFPTLPRLTPDLLE